MFEYFAYVFVDVASDVAFWTYKRYHAYAAIASIVIVAFTTYLVSWAFQITDTVSTIMDVRMWYPLASLMIVPVGCFVSAIVDVPFFKDLGNHPKHMDFALFVAYGLIRLVAIVVFMLLSTYTPWNVVIPSIVYTLAFFVMPSSIKVAKVSRSQQQGSDKTSDRTQAIFNISDEEEALWNSADTNKKEMISKRVWKVALGWLLLRACHLGTVLLVMYMPALLLFGQGIVFAVVSVLLLLLSFLWFVMHRTWISMSGFKISNILKQT